MSDPTPEPHRRDRRPRPARRTRPTPTPPAAPSAGSEGASGGGTLSGVPIEQIRAHLARSCRSQGVPEILTDARTIRAIATLLTVTPPPGTDPPGTAAEPAGLPGATKEVEPR
jgi:hypothetical protein